MRAPAAAGARPRVAVLTPLAPVRSPAPQPIAQAAAALGHDLDLHIFTPTPGASRPHGAVSVQPLSALPSLSSRFDRVVSVLGDTGAHLPVLLHLLQHGGAALLQDARILELYVRHVGLQHTERLIEAELRRPLRPNELWLWLAGDVPQAAFALADVAAVAEPLILHSAAGAAEMSRRYGVQARNVPLSPRRRVVDGSRQAARERLRVGPKDVLLTSFGVVHKGSAPLDAIWAVDTLRSWGIAARLHFVGPATLPLDPLQRMVDDLGLGPHVRLSSAVPDEQVILDHLAAADLAIQLRIGGPGAISHDLVDCIAAGLPSVASASLAAAADAPGYDRAIPDRPSPILVAEAAMALLDERPSTAARHAYAASHGWAAYASRLRAALDLA